MKNVAVFFGGKSCENEISILTGLFILNIIDKEKFNIFPVYIHTNGEFYFSEDTIELALFKKGDFSSFRHTFFLGGDLYVFKGNKGKVKKVSKIDVAINCCHGGWGEGGGVSAIMEINDIPFASPTMTASSIFMDKSITKLIAKSLHIPTLDYLRVVEEDYKKRSPFLIRNLKNRPGFPLVIKPASLGSSIGISLVYNEEEAKVAIDSAFELDNKVIVEKYLDNKTDVNCAAYSLKEDIVVSEPEISCSNTGIYTFDEKYKRTEKIKDTNILTEEAAKKIRIYTKTLYKRMNLNGIVRMDFLCCGDEVYLSEVNIVPGSLAYYLFIDRLSNVKNLISDLLIEAIEKKKNKKILHTGILNTVHISGKNSGVRL